MRQIANGCASGQRGTVLVEKRWWNSKWPIPDAGPQDPDKSAADPWHTQTFIDVHQIRQATDVEVLSASRRFSMRRRAINRRRSIRVDASLPGRSQKFAQCVAEREGDFTQHAFVSGDITPAHNDKVSRCSSSSTMRRAAAASSDLYSGRASRQRSFLLNASRVLRNDAKKAIRFL